MVNEEFIDKWSNIDMDEYEYDNIVKLVKNDIETENSITESTFERIINWKSARSKGYTRKREYEEYKNTFTEILTTENKLGQLKKLYGIGVSIASYILHFIYPDDYPIVDVRTVEALQFWFFTILVLHFRGNQQQLELYSRSLVEVKNYVTLRV